MNTTPSGAEPSTPDDRHEADARETEPVPSAAPSAAEPTAAPEPTAAAMPTAASAAHEPGGRTRSTGPLIAALAVGALIGGAAGGGVVAAVMSNTPTVVSGVTGTPLSISVNDPGNATLVTSVAATALPSIVTIQVSGGGASGSGSGVVFSDEGYIITNSHVATLDGATSDPDLRVTFSDGRIVDATLVGADPLADLAVIQVAETDALVPIEFADSDALNVGDNAIAIGAPLGLSNTVTNGIISALNRSITVQSSAVPQTPNDPLPDGGEAPFDFWNFDSPRDPDAQGQPQQRRSSTISLPVIQTDAAINPGNSGGALLNDDGQLIGINVAIATAGGSGGQAGSIGVGFSIPANYAQRIAAELIATGTASHGLLGATVTSAATASDSTVVGALIDAVSPGGAADLAGLRSGDVITVFNGVPITDQIDLTAQVRVLAGGETTTLVYVRDGVADEVTVTLGELG
ncbi:MAG: trypsin-like peptidase domain-containing protein [Microcella sp.]|uniref:S1C family serine protease n=1 Tax=Microcella sp. TaxID=1913979 RepID=UPI0033157CDB